MNDELAPNFISYEYLIAILRQRQNRVATQAERDYFHNLWHDLLLLDAEVRMNASNKETPRGH